jgi:protoporphyrin/coproporphyrin ferrochelatase
MRLMRFGPWLLVWRIRQWQGYAIRTRLLELQSREGLCYAKGGCGSPGAIRIIVRSVERVRESRFPGDTMKYRSEPKFLHHRAPKTGVLMVNLGTPDAPDRASVRRYLKEFLWDPRVVEMSRPVWWLVLNGIILNTRPARSARAYASVWGAEGSPLMRISKSQHRLLHTSLCEAFADNVHVELAMRYGRPAVAGALQALREQGCIRLLVLPMYPQYSATTTGSVFDAVTDELRRWRVIPELRFINSYHDHPGYITALADSVHEFQAINGRPDRLVMSFHGIPKEYFDDGDPYHCHCHKTARLLAERLGIGIDDYTVTFQSRLGPKEWLRPYTDETLKTLPERGERHVQVVCPGFSVDCLETLEEVAMENRDYFLAAGGEKYEYIPCLNDSRAHIDMLRDLVAKHMAGWEHASYDTMATLSRAKSLGAAR